METAQAYANLAVLDADELASSVRREKPDDPIDVRELALLLVSPTLGRRETNVRSRFRRSPRLY
jgi:hypothetical protein